MTVEDTTSTADESTLVPPGRWTTEKLIAAIEAVKRDETGDDWSFNIDQQNAIRHETGPLHLTAGPGAGKTEVVGATVLKWLLVDGVHPTGIIVTTFTEKAARNLKQRLESRLTALGYAGVISVDDLYVGTNHELWGEIMRDFRFDDYRNIQLLDAEAQEMFISQMSDYVDVLAQGDIAAFPDAVPSPENHIRDDTCSKAIAAGAATTLFNRISQFRVDVDELVASDDPAHQRLADGYRDYLDSLRNHSRCDFARLQVWFLDFLESEAGERFVTGDDQRDQAPLQRIAVDEYQDVNPLQQEIYFRLAELMPDSPPTMMVVGDDDQALYRFRGGTVDCLIEFADRLVDRLGLDPDAVTSGQLRMNYRSRPEIVQWTNRHIGHNPTMQVPGARANGKEPIRAHRDPTDEPNVLLLKGDTKADAAAQFAMEVERLRADGGIEDFSQVALLAHSTREYWSQWDSRTFVGECVSALEARNIPVHNPRNKAFAEHEEIQAMLGALARCFDPDLQWAEENVLDYGGLGNKLDTWTSALERVIDRHGATELQAFIEETAGEIRTATEGKAVRLSPVGVFNRLRSLPPFSTWTETANPARKKRLGKLSQMLDSFEGIARGLTDDRRLTRTTHDDFATTSVRFLSDFYWTFCQYLENVPLDDPEDPYDTFPEDHVQVLTVHQAKGLEFPIVFVASLERTSDKVVTFEDGDPLPRLADQLAPYTERTPPTDVVTRAERDLIRQFYVAHSRAQDKLVLLSADYYLRGADGSTVLPSLGADDGVPLTESWFDSSQRVDQGARIAPPGTAISESQSGGLQRPYSIVGDVLSFRRCKRQYGYLADSEFAAGRQTQLFAGLVVHQTLDWAHRYYNGDVEGVTGGSVPSTSDLREEFDDVVTALRDQRILPMGTAAVDAVFEHVARFNRRIGPDLYPKIIDTECTLRFNTGSFLLTGVADVIADDDGNVQLCDYKASTRPDGSSGGYLDDYREQLLVYAGLFARKEGIFPDSVVLYFLGEDDPEDTRLEFEFTEADVRAAMDRFTETVHHLEHARETNSWSVMDPDNLPDEATCDECPVRWDCQYRDYDDR
ncbi:MULTISPECIES: ATP-dependent DNA helicase [Natrialbaceae]|uniref:ATP-dependent DNA helicase n=1 Tax=Natrialbaceae TaxID=1644061 RepID=UPI00207CF28A|nr:ATP-dependent DNA helicase [Natronococcus sp. CG52]